MGRASRALSFLLASMILSGGVAAAGGFSAGFEQNVGQTDAQVRFLSRSGGYTLFLTPREAVMDLAPATSGAGRGAVLRMSLRGANPEPGVAGSGPLATTSRYYGSPQQRGWVGEAAHFAAVTYQGVYPGIDLVFHNAGEERFEYDFRIAPGADYRSIELAFAGADRMAIDAQGRLVLGTPAGTVVQRPPAVYEETAGGRRELAGRYVRTRRGIGFAVDGHDPRAALVIDPVVVFSTYLGGKPGGGGGYTNGKRDGADFAVDCTVDGAGNVYLTGVTSSADFPTAGAIYGHVDGFNPWIGKLGPDGHLIYATYLPGTHGVPDVAGFNGGTGVVVDAAGNAYVAGLTQSPALPATPNALQKTYNGGMTDAFVVELDPDGKLVYLSYLGGSGFDTVSCEALSADGSFNVSGATSSDNFPVAGALQAKRRSGGNVFGGLDVFVTRFKPGFKGLAFSTFLGGSGDEATSGLTVDASGSVLVTGWTGSTDFPLANAFQTTHKGGVATRSFGIPTDVFVAKLSRDGSTLRYSTFLGGSGPEYPDPDNFTRRIAVDREGNAYVISDTASADFPTTPDAFQRTFGGGVSDAFLVKLSPAGGLLYGTFLGGSGGERGRSIVLDAAGDVLIAGQTFSPNFRTVNPVQDKLAGEADAFVLKLDPSLTRLLFSTYLGGGAADGALGIDLGSDGDVYVAGSTFSNDFPTTPGAQEPKFGGPPEDAFVTRLDLRDYTQAATLSLARGLNLISLPLKPRAPFTARSLAAHLGATLVIAFDETQQRFLAFAPGDSGDGFAIEGTRGYFVQVPEGKQVVFTGAPWTTGNGPLRLATAGGTKADVLAWLQVELERLLK
jgi:Beta-propeller repeat